MGLPPLLLDEVGHKPFTDKCMHSVMSGARSAILSAASKKGRLRTICIHAFLMKPSLLLPFANLALDITLALALPFRRDMSSVIIRPVNPTGRRPKTVVPHDPPDSFGRTLKKKFFAVLNPVLERVSRLRLLMLPDSRSLNLSNSAAVLLYEAWRQIDYKNGL